jgi:hypothetical protein
MPIHWRASSCRPLRLLHVHHKVVLPGSFYRNMNNGDQRGNRKGILTANWEDGRKEMDPPVGGGAGRVFKIGKLPIKIMLAGYRA